MNTATVASVEVAPDHYIGGERVSSSDTFVAAIIDTFSMGRADRIGRAIRAGVV